MVGLYIPSKAIEAMPLDVDRIELGVGRYMDMRCRSTEGGFNAQNIEKVGKYLPHQYLSNCQTIDFDV